jgi:RNase P subunit RPR2
MIKKLSRKEALEKIDNFFRQTELHPNDVKKIKRLAMKYNLKLGKYRRRFCKKCLNDLRSGRIRVTKCYKTVVCGVCWERNRWKID